MHHYNGDALIFRLVYGIKSTFVGGVMSEFSLHIEPPSYAGESGTTLSIFPLLGTITVYLRILKIPYRCIFARTCSILSRGPVQFRTSYIEGPST